MVDSSYFSKYCYKLDSVKSRKIYGRSYINELSEFVLKKIVQLRRKKKIMITKIKNSFFQEKMKKL